MPYIRKPERLELDRVIDKFGNLDVGQLNYVITKLMIKYIQDNTLKYKYYNDLVGVLECAKLELYRRKVIPYENMKMSENGDVK